MNHTEFISKLEELSHIIQGTSVSAWDLLSAQVTSFITMLVAAGVTGFLVLVPLMTMHSAVKEETKGSSGIDNAILWSLAMSIALMCSIGIGVLSWRISQEFISTTHSHEKELKEQYDLYQQTSTDLYNQLADMSDDEFEKLATANSKFELTKEEKAKYKYVTKTVDKVSENKNKSK
jgi:hypothetical protein